MTNFCQLNLSIEILIVRVILRNHIEVSPNILKSQSNVFINLEKKTTHNFSAEVILDRIIISR